MQRFKNRALVIVDSEARDAEATAVALTACGYTGPIYRFGQEDEALDFLYQRGRFLAHKGDAQPSLVILGISERREGPLQTVQDVRQSSELQSLPMVVVVPGTGVPLIDRCYKCGADAVLLRPESPQARVELLGHVLKFWVLGPSDWRAAHEQAHGKSKDAPRQGKKPR